MPGRRSMRYHQRRLSDDEFETPAFQVAAERNDPPRAALDESDDDLQSESGLGESPEEDFIEEGGESSDDAGKEGDPGSDSDSAPEEVSFAKSREAEEKRQQLITGEIRKGKSEERERRRKRDELFKLQRKEKLAALNKRKLPEELLEELGHPSDSEKKLKTDGSNQDEKDDKEVAGSGDDVKEDLGSDSDEEEEEEEEDGGEGSAEFLPLTKTQQGRVQVVSLEGSKGQGGVVAQSVADFKQAMLYGRRHKRVTSEQARNIQAKRMARR